MQATIIKKPKFNSTTYTCIIQKEIGGEIENHIL